MYPKVKNLRKEASQIKPVDERKQSHFKAGLPACGGGTCSWFILCTHSQSVNTECLYFILFFTFIASSSALRNLGLPQRTQSQLGCITFQAVFYFFKFSPFHLKTSLSSLQLSSHKSSTYERQWKGGAPAVYRQLTLSLTHSRLLENEGPSRTWPHSLAGSYHILFAICCEDLVSFVFSAYLLDLQARKGSVFTLIKNCFLEM